MYTRTGEPEESDTFGYPASRIATIPDLLIERADECADKVCFRYLLSGRVDGPVQTLTFGELARDARSIAATLQDMGMRGQRALLLYPHGLDFVKAFFGCLLARVIAVPLYHRQHAHAIESIAEDCGAQLILTIESLSDGLAAPSSDGAASHDGAAPHHAGSRTTRLRHLTTDRLSSLSADAFEPIHIPSESLAFLQYTSGSTSQPKGVMVSHRNLTANLAFLMAKVGHEHKHVVMWLPFYHDLGLIGGVLWTVYAGLEATLLSPGSFLKRPYRWLSAASQLRATTLAAPDFTYDLLVERTTPEQRQALDLSAVRIAVTGAEPIRATTIDKFCEAFAVSGFQRDAFYPSYGLAESTLLSSAPRAFSPLDIRAFDADELKRGAAVLAHASTRQAIRLVGCGSSPAEQLLEIVDPDTRRRVPDEHVGEVWISGPCVSAGYWGAPSATKEVFQAEVVGRPEDLKNLKDLKGHRYLRTGDLGFLCDGTLFITGRIKDIIIQHGQNIYPQDIEYTVERALTFIAAGSCAVFAIEVRTDVHTDAQTEQLVLLVEIPKHRHDDADNIIDQIRGAVWQEHLLPLYTVVLLSRSGIPKTTSGKVRRFKCREMFLANQFDEIARSVVQLEPGAGDEVELEVAEPESDIRAQTEIEHMRVMLVALLSAHMKVSAKDIDVERPLYTYGLDSVRLLAITRALEERLSRVLSPMTLYNHASIEELARYLTEPNGAEQSETSTPDSLHVLDTPIPGTAPGTAMSAGTLAGATAVANHQRSESPLSSMREYTLATRDVDLTLCEWGPDDGHTVICLHGIKDQGASWAVVGDQLAERGLRVVAPDFRGHGHSSHVTSYHLAGFLADLGEVIDHLFRGELFTLVGHSMGARVAALVAALRPEYVAALIMVEPAVEREHVWSSPLERVRMLRELASRRYQHTTLANVRDAAHMIVQAAPGLALDVAYELAERHTIAAHGEPRVTWRWDAKLNAHYQSEGVFSSEFGFAELMSELKVRVEVVQGETSGARDAFSRDVFSGLLAPTRHHVLPGGHNLHLESPHDLAMLIAQTVQG